MDKVPFFYILDKKLLSLVFFDASHSSRYEVISHCGFDLYFSMISDFGYLFMYLLAIHKSLGKCLFRFFVQFLIGLFVFYS